MPEQPQVPGLLQGNLLGQYVAMFLIVHAGFGCLLYVTQLTQTAASLALIAGGSWIIGRAVGAYGGRWVTPLVTTALLAAVLLLTKGREIVPHSAIFSPLVFVGMLVIVLIADVLDLLARRMGSWQALGNSQHALVLWGLSLTFVIFMVIIPTGALILEWLNPEPGRGLVPEMTLYERVRLGILQGMVALTFFTVGGNVGSFLNVVAFRMPRGESVVFSPSRCPACETQIRATDNIPILGWLFLRGQCRNCQVKISPRYPIVEAIAAVMFLLLYFVELISGGANIAVRRPNIYTGVLWIIFYTKFDLLALYFFHCFSLSVLLAWALVDYDRQRVPWKANGLMIGILLVALTCWGGLLPVPWYATPFQTAGLAWLNGLPRVGLGAGLIGGLVGTLVGLLVRLLLEYGNRRPDSVLPRFGHTVGCSAIVGVTLGWQAVSGVWLLTLVIYPIMLGFRSKCGELPLTIAMLAAYLLQLVGWRWLTDSWGAWWPSPATTVAAWPVVAVVLGFLALVNRFAAGSPTATSDPTAAAVSSDELPPTEVGATEPPATPPETAT